MTLDEFNGAVSPEREGSVILGTREYERGSDDAAGNDGRIQTTEGRFGWIR